MHPPSPLTIRALALFFANLGSLGTCITYNQVEIRPYVKCSPDKAGVPQPKLAYRVDCHNIMHKKLSGIILNLQGTLLFLETCCLESIPGENPTGNPGYHPSERIFQHVSSHMLVL